MNFSAIQLQWLWFIRLRDCCGWQESAYMWNSGDAGTTCVFLHGHCVMRTTITDARQARNWQNMR